MAKNPDDDLRQAVALFRHGLIADLVNLPPGTAGIGAGLRAKAGRDYDIPGTDRTRVAAETLRDWVRLYRRGGFDALHPRPRADRGRPRRLSAEVAELLISIKTHSPAFSVRAVIDQARRQGVPDDVRLASSTVHRLLAREGLLERDALDGIGALNRRLWAWIEGEYHQAPHRGLDGDTPLDRWATAGADVRYPDPGPEFDDVFLFEDRCRAAAVRHDAVATRPKFQTVVDLTH